MERSELLLLIGLEVVVALSLLCILPNQQDRAVFCCIVSKEGDNWVHVASKYSFTVISQQNSG